MCIILLDHSRKAVLGICRMNNNYKINYLNNTNIRYLFGYSCLFLFIILMFTIIHYSLF